MQNHVVKIESDAGITIPPEILEKLGPSDGDDVEFEIENGKLFLARMEIGNNE